MPDKHIEHIYHILKYGVHYAMVKSIIFTKNVWCCKKPHYVCVVAILFKRIANKLSMHFFPPTIYFLLQCLHAFDCKEHFKMYRKKIKL